MSSFWSWWVIIITLGSIAGCVILLQLTRRMPGGDEVKNESMGHSFDGIEEYNNPLPKWWLYMFYATIVFGIAYLAYYPVGNWEGLGKWTSHKQHAAQVQRHEERFGPLFANLAAQPIEDLIHHEQARKIGQRLYANNCSVCHGTAATGSRGFPNLTDGDWLYGGSPDAIKQTIMHGRVGQMPPWGAMLGQQGVNDVVAHVQSLSGLEHNAEAAARGSRLYATSCAACHGTEGKGNLALGAPNLTDEVWLYGGTREDIYFTIYHGRNGNMPAHKELLGEDKVHLVSAYIYSLTNK